MLVSKIELKVVWIVDQVRRGTMLKVWNSRKACNAFVKLSLALIHALSYSDVFVSRQAFPRAGLQMTVSRNDVFNQRLKNGDILASFHIDPDCVNGAERYLEYDR